MTGKESAAKRLNNKVAVVAEAGRGIGRAVAEGLAREGATVIVHYEQNETRARAVAEGILRSGGWAAPFRADLSRRADLQRLFANVVAHFGRLDVLVNNSGVFGDRPENTPGARCGTSVVGRTFCGLLFATLEAARWFSPEGGRIISLSAEFAGDAPNPVVRAAVQVAVNSLTLALASALGPRGVTVNAVAPDLTRAGTRNTALDQASDVADLVAFLCSEDARGVTGRTLPHESTPDTTKST